MSQATTDQNKNTDKKDEDFISLKGLRTFDNDIKEYKRRLEKYGKEQADLYDPYINVKDGFDLSDKDQNVEMEEKKEEGEESEKVDEPTSEVRSRQTQVFGQSLQSTGKTEGKQSSDFKDVIAERHRKAKTDDENIPFVELLKNRLKNKGHAPIYNPHIPKSTDKPGSSVKTNDDRQDVRRGKQEEEKSSQIYSPNIKSSLKREPDRESKSQSPPVQQPRDKEAELRAEVERLSREHAEWKQKLDYYQKNIAKAFEEKERQGLKKTEIENLLKPLLVDEKKLEEKIRIIQREERQTPDEEIKRQKEKDRWAKEDRRQQLERDKWKRQDNLKEVSKQLEDKTLAYDTLKTKQSEAEENLKRLEKEKDIKSTELRLFGIRRLKADIEANKTKLALQIKSFEDSIKRLSEGESKIIAEKDAIEEKEHVTSDPAEEKMMEAKRWEMEEKLRKVEQERWQISDKQKRLLEILADISGQHNKIIKEEKEALYKLENSRSARGVVFSVAEVK